MQGPGFAFFFLGEYGLGVSKLEGREGNHHFHFIQVDASQSEFHLS